MQTLYTLIIDTNGYSGNFEREMCGYITAQVGECGVGQEKAVEAKHELSQETQRWFEQYVVQRSEDDEDSGCMRPCAIVPTPGRVNDGMGVHYDTAGYTGKSAYPAYESVGIFLSAPPTAEIFRVAKERAEEFVKQYRENMPDKELKIVNVRLIENVRTVTDIDPNTLA